MKLALIRHAIAQDRKSFSRTGRPDDERPLTDEGRRKMCEVARALPRWLGSLDLLATSPLVRAKETADLVAEELPKAKRVTWAELSPDADPAELLERLREHKELAVIAA